MNLEGGVDYRGERTLFAGQLFISEEFFKDVHQFNRARMFCQVAFVLYSSTSQIIKPNSNMIKPDSTVIRPLFQFILPLFKLINPLSTLIKPP